MKLLILIFTIFSTVIFGQSMLPNLNLSNSVDFKNDSESNEVKNLLKLKKDEIAVSFYTNGGLGYHLYIDNFIFKENGNVKHYKEEVYFKRGKKFKKRNIKLSELEKIRLKNIVKSDFFENFSKLTQTNFQYSQNNHQICATGFINDAPENFIMITQNNKSNIIMVYLPINNIKCSYEESPLMKFIELHRLFNIKLDR
ncbi:hypothetical protein [Chryseobacterium binzhouense]|uniref:hypothetical protein n=1 Tax=Chryseobacterium binzhouense TaxID=2593646 RepID=UPI0028968A5A|nr:hypothetical protein [Chryseobacterium binzhouense]